MKYWEIVATTCSWKYWQLRVVASKPRCPCPAEEIKRKPDAGLDAGLEPAANRLRACHSTDWVNRAATARWAAGPNIFVQ